MNVYVESSRRDQQRQHKYNSKGDDYSRSGPNASITTTQQHVRSSRFFVIDATEHSQPAVATLIDT